MQKKWNVIKSDTKLRASLSKALNISPILAQILIHRKIRNKEELDAFIKADISCLHKPILLPDMEKAIKRIRQAIKRKEKVFLFGDYDVDGITSCALLKLTLERMGLKTLYYLPHRIREGYGINKEAVLGARNKGVSLFISVDCGIANFKEIELLNNFNIDTIVIDHHEPQDLLPKAQAVVNPKVKGHNYPFKDLAGVGVVYKLCQALSQDYLIEDLDLVLLGTIADVVPLIGENRILVREGLTKLSATKKPGLQELIRMCQLQGKELGPYSISFILGPRLNAAGRVASADIAFKLLLTSSHLEAKVLAGQLESENKRRQEIEGKILDEALAKVEREVNFKNHNIIVLSNQDWHRGVLGIVASRITDKFYRPTIIISTSDSLGKGSARSIRDFHMFNALSKCGGLLEAYGGHSHAAGLTILRHNIEGFSLKINEIAKLHLEPCDLIPTLDIDAQVQLKDINLDLISKIRNLAPFGTGNPEPTFASYNLFLRGRPSILGRRTLKFWVSDGKMTYQAIGFGMSDMFDTVVNSKRIDLAYSPSIDSWQDNNQIQLELKDIRPSL